MDAKHRDFSPGIKKSLCILNNLGSATANVYLVLLQIVQFLGQALSELLNVGRTDGPEERVGRLKYVSFVDDLLGLDLIV